MHWLYYFVLLAVLLCGIGIQLFNLPGLWLMAAAGGVYALMTSAHYLFPWGLIVVLALCVLGELLEFWARAAGAKKAGGSNRAMILGTIGGVAGGLLLSIPVPILGTIAGVCIGAFLGAMAGQMTVHQDVGHSAVVGFGAAKGTLVGLVIKLGVACVIFLFIAWRALPIGAAPTSTGGMQMQPATSPPLMPQTVPTTLPMAE